MKLNFINGSLLYALLGGGQIIAEKHDGYDHHLIVLNHNAKEDEPRFTHHHTNNYEHKNPEFSASNKKITERDRAKVQKWFDDYITQETNFKDRYPKPDNMPTAS